MEQGQDTLNKERKGKQKEKTKKHEKKQPFPLQTPFLATKQEETELNKNVAYLPTISK